MMMKLYTYFRSSAAYRVRIALGIKQISYESIPIHLRKNGGEHRSADYRALNPQGLVPTLVHGDYSLSQSLAVIEYLEELQPDPLLLPGSKEDRAVIRSMAQLIACDIHPLQNLRILEYLRNELHQDDGAVQAWARHWIDEGLNALEHMVTPSSAKAPYCFGESVTLADICLVPQMANARRFGCDVFRWPKLVAIEAHLRDLEPFRSAAPESQPDAE